MEQSAGRSAPSWQARFRRLLKGHVWLRLRGLVTLFFFFLGGGGARYKYTYSITHSPPLHRWTRWIYRLYTCGNHRLRNRILRVLKFPKIHAFLRILKLSILKFLKFKLSQLSPPSSKKLFVTDTLNFWVKNSVMSTIQDSLTCQQFSMITNMQQSLRIACSLAVFASVRIGVLNCPLFAFTSCLSVIDCGLFSTVASVVRIRRFCSY